MKLSTFIISLILFTGTLLPAAGSENRFFFQHPVQAGGLPDSSVSSIVQDYRGFIWFGTLNGLVRYDGMKTTLFEHDPYNRASLPHNKIQTMVAYKHSILIGTYDGLSILDVDTEKFRNFSKIPGDSSSLSNSVVVSILPDNDGKIWVGTLQGLNRLDPKTGKCEVFFHNEKDSSSIANDVIRSLYRDKQGKIWIGTYSGLDCYNRKTGHFLHFGLTGGKGFLLPSKYVMSIRGGEGNTLWVGTWGGGISSFNTVSHAVASYSLDDNRVYTVSTDKKGKVWAGTWGGGLFILHILSKKVEKYIQEPGNAQSLSNNTVYSIMRDSQGFFWIGTKGGGINKVDLNKKNPIVLYHDKKDPSSLTDGNVYSLYEDTKGFIWIGTDNGLDRWSRKTGVIEHFRKGNGSGLTENAVTDIIQDSTGNLLISTLKGIFVLNSVSMTFSPLSSLSGKDISLPGERVYALFEDSSLNLWVGTYDNGCYRINRKTGKENHYLHNIHDEGSLSDNLVTSFLEMDHEIWIGTNNGLNKFIPGKGAFIHYYLDPDNVDSISSNSIRMLFLDSKQRMWIATEGGGLDRYNKRTNGFSHYLKQNGLSGNSVQGILEDNSGNIWCATKKGISILSPDSGKIVILDESDGLPDSSLNYGVLKSRDGYLYFSSKKGITRFLADTKKPAKYNPPLYITDIETLGENVNTIPVQGGARERFFPYTKNLIIFHYICLDYSDPLRNRYKYYLEGFDDSWKNAGDSTSALYAGIPAGTYTFKVKASVDNESWLDKTASVTIHIAPPFWRSWWAQIVYDILLVILLYALIKIRHHYKLKKKVAELELLRNELLQSNRMLKKMSVKDALTGLYNRRELNERIVVEVNRARRFKEPLSVFMADIDFFKDYNDRYGHIEGDACLVSIADIFRKCLTRDSDFIARYGGEEFCIVIPDCGAETAQEIGEKIKRAVQKKRIEHKKTGLGGIVTLSVGITSGIPGKNEDAGQFIKTADKALYKAKGSGRNKTVYRELPKTK